MAALVMWATVARASISANTIDGTDVFITLLFDSF
jgi:hypothetical protein